MDFGVLRMGSGNLMIARAGRLCTVRPDRHRGRGPEDPGSWPYSDWGQAPGPPAAAASGSPRGAGHCERGFVLEKALPPAALGASPARRSSPAQRLLLGLRTGHGERGNHAGERCGIGGCEFDRSRQNARCRIYGQSKTTRSDVFYFAHLKCPHFLNSQD